MNVNHWGGTLQSSIGASVTRYFNGFMGVEVNATESQIQPKLASAGTITNVGLYLSANDRADSTWRARKNTANGNAVVTLTSAGSPGQFEDTSSTDSVADDDLFNYSIATGAGGTTIVPSDHWHTFAPASGTVTIMSAANTASFSGTADVFYPLPSPYAGSTTSANEQNTIAVAATMERMMVGVPINTRSDQSDFRSRVNTGNGNLLCTYAAGATGVVEDTSNTDTVADGDEVGWSWDQGGGTGSLSGLKVFKVEITATNAFPIFAAGSGTNQAFGTTHYHPVSGALHYGETTEADSQLKSNTAFTWSDLHSHVSTNTVNGATTIRGRVNGSNVNQTVAYGASGTGQQSDTSSTDAVADDDEVDLSCVTAGSSGNMVLRALSSLATGASVGTDLSVGSIGEPVIGGSTF